LDYNEEYLLGLLRTSKIINISNYDLNRANAELEKIRKHDEDRADRIEAMF